MDYRKNKPIHWVHELFLFNERRESDQPVRFFHSHEGLELLYVHEGSGKIMIEENLYTVGSPSLVVVQPNQMHCTDFGPPYVRSLIKINPASLREWLPMLPGVNRFFRQLTEYRLQRQVFACTPPQAAGLDTLFRQLRELMSLARKEELAERVSIFLLHLLSYLELAIFPADVDAAPLHARHIDRILDWIELHYTGPFKLERLADELHLSAGYLSRHFREHMGITVTEYVTGRRLRQANALLRATNKTIEQIGRESGFADPSYFGRVFKHKYGVTPAQYRAESSRMDLSF